MARHLVKLFGAVALFLAGCLPELADECTTQADCNAERPLCRGGVCVPTADAEQPGDDGGPPDTDLGDDPDTDVDPDTGADCVVTGPETCNGADDDCDGRTDEGPGGGELERACYSGDPATQGRGMCRAGRAVCVDGAFGPCQGEVVPVAEECVEGEDCSALCNGDDDDCDGQADEDLVRGCGPEQAVGLCRRGTDRCVEGIWAGCEGAVTEALEICDNEDNDCDLSADENLDDCDCTPPDRRDCYSGPPGTVGTGVCASGFQDCQPEGRYGRCLEQILPTDELCDGVDNDCDGSADEGIGGGPCPVGDGACRVEGVVVCDGGSGAVTCEGEPGVPEDERCNGIDDDCDGSADEGFRLGEACAAGEGECARNGVRICDADGRATCDAVPGAPVDEVCNGRDDDCDGRVDEGEPGEPLAEQCYEHPDGNPGIGGCSFGRRTCVEGNWTQCEGDQPPFAERCNQVDDDCNGEVDDVPDGDCSCTIGEVQPCYGGPDGTAGRGRCSEGMQRCIELDSGATAFGECEGEVLPDDEACNGADDDCDGTLDEGEFGPCSLGLGICAADGVFVCDGGDLDCNAERGLPVTEICNGEDDDCNGTVDDIDATECTVGDGGCARTGRRFCADGADACDATPGDPAPEICNGVDDDCNGIVDDIGRMACTVGQGACARDGIVQCLDGEPRCMGEPGQPGDEQCNEIDDDCDGQVDEGTFGDCQVGEGSCEARGEQICVDGVIECEAPPPEGEEEVCNGEDDDCDGTADEDPNAICPPVPNASTQCQQAACTFQCDAQFFDRDDDAENGCERGCGAQLSGQEFNTNGRPLAVAGRTVDDTFAIAWIDNRNRPFISIDGAAAVRLNNQGLAGAEAIHIVGTDSGWSVLVAVADAASVAYDVVLDADGSIQQTQAFETPRVIDDPVLIPTGTDAVLLAYTVAAGIDDAQLVLLERRFAGAFPANVAVAANSGTGWVGAPALTGVVLDGQPVVVGGISNANNNNNALRAYFVQSQSTAEVQVGDFDIGDGALVVGARPDGMGALIAAGNAIGGGVLPLAADPAAIGALTVAALGTPGGVMWGPEGPVVAGVTGGGNVVGLVFEEAGLAGPVLVTGPTQMVDGAGGAGAIPASAATTTRDGRRIIAWRDRQADVQWAESPCQ